jgi:cysteine desulfurase
LEPTLPERIYLDHAATTPILPAAKAAVAEAMERWANPSSPHAEGRAARAALEDARARIKAALGWDGALIFTSGASEALAIALGRAKVERRLVSAVEHDAVFRAAPDAEILPIRNAAVDEDVLADKLAAGGKAIVAIQHVNPETGTTLRDRFGTADPLAALIRERGGLILCDCAQSGGSAVELRALGFSGLPDADILVLSAHKLGGPPGIGALLVRDLGMLEAIGGQEQGYRGGTENLPGAMGFAAALEALQAPSPEFVDATFAFRNFIWGVGGLVPGEGGHEGTIFAVAMPNLSAAAQLIRLDQAGFAVSAGSACSSGSLKPSRVLKAFGVPDEVAARTIRVSFGWTTKVADIHAFQQAWESLADEARARAA